jgi:hypothetical protein
MTNLDNIRRLLAETLEEIDNIEHYCDSEIVGEDARHLLCDTVEARRELLWIKPEDLKESYQVKPLYDRLKSVKTSIRVLRNTLDRADAAVEKALDNCGDISSSVESRQSPDDDEL